MTSSWYIKTARGEEGPLTFEELVEAAQRGGLGPMDTVREGSGPWRFADSVRGLHNLLPRLRRDISPPPARLADQWYWQALGFEMGPIGLDDISRMVKSGQLQNNDKVRPEGSAQWRRVADCPEFVFHDKSVGPVIVGRPDDPVSPGATAPDSWFYRWDDKIHGPVGWHELLDLFSHSRELAREALVRREGEQEWAPFEAVVGSADPIPPESASQPSAKAFSQPPHDMAGRLETDRSTRVSGSAPKLKGRRRVKEIISDNVGTVAAITIWIFINASALYFLSDPYTQERRYLAELRQIVDEVHSLQARDASIAEWKDFRGRTKESLGRMVKALKKSASASKPLQQQLLWAARDEIPRILGPRGRDNEKRQKELDAHLRSVENAMAGATTSLGSNVQ